MGAGANLTVSTGGAEATLTCVKMDDSFGKLALGESLQLFISMVGTVMPASDSSSRKIFGSKRDNISLSEIFGSVSLPVASSLRITTGNGAIFISAGVIAVSS